MKTLRNILAVALLGGMGALASTIVPLGQAYWTETQPATRAVPDGGCGSTGLGASLANVSSMHLQVQCTDGSNIVAGNEIGWYCSPSSNLWSPAPTYTNCALPTGNNPATCPELVVYNPFGRFLFQSSGVSCSGGSWDGGVIVTLERAQQ